MKVVLQYLFDLSEEVFTVYKGNKKWDLFMQGFVLAAFTLINTMGDQLS